MLEQQGEHGKSHGLVMLHDRDAIRLQLASLFSGKLENVYKALWSIIFEQDA